MCLRPIGGLISQFIWLLEKLVSEDKEEGGGEVMHGKFHEVGRNFGSLSH